MHVTVVAVTEAPTTTPAVEAVGGSLEMDVPVVSFGRKKRSARERRGDHLSTMTSARRAMNWMEWWAAVMMCKTQRAMLAAASKVAAKLAKQETKRSYRSVEYIFLLYPCVFSLDGYDTDRIS